MKVHALKLLPQFYQIIGKEKKFEIRKNDRDFKVGDTLWLQEWSPETEYTGRSQKFAVTYLLQSVEYGLQEGYCIMGIGPERVMRASTERGG